MLALKWLPVIVLTLFVVREAQAFDDEFRTIVILHTNDVQGRLLPQSYYDEEERGGWARLYHLLRTLGSEREEVLIIDGGDALGPAILSHYDAGRLAVELMAQVGYDAMVVGNHEFDFGRDTLAVRMQEAPFPFLGANVRDRLSGEPLFASHCLVERNGIRIGLVGLLSPELKKIINPNKNPEIEIFDPGEALRGALEALGEEVDLRLAMTHMSEEEVHALAASFPEVELFVGGGFGRPGAKGALRRLAVLTGGTHIVTTPGRGAFIGRLELVFARAGDGWKVADLRSHLIPVDDQTPEDPAAVLQIAGLLENFEQQAAEQLAYAVEEISDTPRLMADLLRTALKKEVAIINLGALREYSFAGTITRGDVDYLIRFDDQLVTLEVTGEKLRRMAASSKTRERHGQRLVFSGYDPETDKVGGRPLEANEIYQVATTGFLAAGGDAYFSGQELLSVQDHMLKELLLDHLDAYPRLGRRDGLTWRRRGVWKMQTKLSGSLAHTGFNTQAGSYRGISFLTGSNAMVWNSVVDNRLSYEQARGSLVNRLRSNFGQLRRDGKFSKAADRLELETVYTLRQQLAPFVAVNISTVWTYPEADKRPTTLRGSSGTHLRWGPDFRMRLGLGIECDFADRTNAVGLEMVPEYRRTFQQGNSFFSTMKIFVGATEGHKVSLQHYNGLSLSISGNFSIAIDANYFLYRDSQVEALGFKNELQIGLGYTWDTKWF